MFNAAQTLEQFKAYDQKLKSAFWEAREKSLEESGKALDRGTRFYDALSQLQAALAA